MSRRMPNFSTRSRSRERPSTDQLSSKVREGRALQMCFTPSAAVGQTNGSRKNGPDLWTAQARRALDRSIFYGSVRNRNAGLRLTLGRQQDVQGLLFVNPVRARTVSVGLLLII